MTQTVRDAVGRLHATLENLAAALEAGRPEGVLDAEPSLAEAVHRLTGLTHPGRLDQASLASLIAVRVSIERCQSLGRCAGDFADAISPAGYGSSGSRLGARTPGVSVTARS